MNLNFWKPKTDPATAWSRPYDVNPLRQRLAALAADDPLQPLLLGFIDATLVSQADTRVSADHAAHQFVGHQNALSNLRDDLQRLWRETHAVK